MTDQWPYQGTTASGGLIQDGFTVGFCYCTAGVTEGYVVKVGTHATGKIPVTVSAAIADGIGVALKTGSTGETIPVVFQGIVKLDTSSGVTLGQYVTNASGGATVVYLGATFSTNGVIFGGASYALGRALQTATSGDEILVYVNPI